MYGHILLIMMMTKCAQDNQIYVITSQCHGTGDGCVLRGGKPCKGSVNLYIFRLLEPEPDTPTQEYTYEVCEFHTQELINERGEGLEIVDRDEYEAWEITQELLTNETLVLPTYRRVEEIFRK